jgi:hypothetical protein
MHAMTNVPLKQEFNVVIMRDHNVDFITPCMHMQQG